MVNSSGHCSYYFSNMPSRRFERFLTIREFGAIGNGLAFAMGVAAARPNCNVVLFDGDGSVMMHIQEFETMRRHGMKILICILNDGAYGSEIHKLRSEGLDDGGAVFGRPDFAAIARGFGLSGHRIDDLSGLSSLTNAVNGPTVWDFHVSDKVASPLMQRAHPQRGSH
jgi:thiamine pyrophosphate-dependent acetolactate synthase large subunit-like protein